MKEKVLRPMLPSDRPLFYPARPTMLSAENAVRAVLGMPLVTYVGGKPHIEDNK